MNHRNAWIVGAIAGGLVLLGGGVGIGLAVSGNSSGSSSSSSGPADTCAALVGRRVDPNVTCSTPDVGTVHADAFTCDGPASTDGNFYYINDDQKSYIYGVPGDTWRQAVYEQSLGPISTDLGCG